MSFGLIYPKRVFMSFGYCFNDVGGSVLFVPFAGVTPLALCSDPSVRIVAPGPGYVHSVSVECDVTTMGDTDIDAVADLTGDPSTVIGTQSVDISVADKGYVARFGDGAPFAAGSRVGISIDPTGAMANVAGVVVLVVEVNP